MKLSFRTWLEADAAKFEEYDLQKRYAHFNELLFDNKLPTIPIKYANIKEGGVVNFKVLQTNPPNPRLVRMGLVDRYQNGKMLDGSLNMKISNRFKKSEQGLDAILVHEMIHVYFAVNGPLGEQHGIKFQRMARELSQKVGFEIPLTDNIERYGLSDDIKVREVGVQVLFHKDGTAKFAIMGSKALVAALPDFISRWEMMTAPKMNGSFGRRTEFWTVASPKWTELSYTYPIQRRQPRDIGFYPLKDMTAIDDLKKNGKLLGTLPPAGSELSHPPESPTHTANNPTPQS